LLSKLLVAYIFCKNAKFGFLTTDAGCSTTLGEQGLFILIESTGLGECLFMRVNIGFAFIGVIRDRNNYATFFIEIIKN
jgi:hypothetical protein